LEWLLIDMLDLPTATSSPRLSLGLRFAAQQEGVANVN
jgi:hypothetical protein